MITTDQRLEAFWKMFTEQTAQGKPEFIPRLHVYRQDELLAVCYGIHSSQVAAAVPLVLGAFRADLVTHCSDAWALSCPEGTSEAQIHALLDKYGSISGAFEAHHPWATEALQLAEYGTDGTIAFGQVSYVRRSTYLKRNRTFTETVAPDQKMEGRAVPSREILGRVADVRGLLEGVGDRLRLPSLGMDMVAQRLLRRMLDLDFALLVPYEEEDVPADISAMIDAIAADMGYVVDKWRVGDEGA